MKAIVTVNGDLLVRRHRGGDLSLLVLRQPVSSRELLPLRLHLVPELRIRLQTTAREQDTAGMWMDRRRWMGLEEGGREGKRSEGMISTQ